MKLFERFRRRKPVAVQPKIKMASFEFEQGPSGPISMKLYDTLHTLENLGHIELVSNGYATETEAEENRWYLEQQDADPEAFTADAVGEELRAVLTAPGSGGLLGAAKGGGEG